jgi:4-hydroxybenzoate polyprenyltransferase
MKFRSFYAYIRIIRPWTGCSLLIGVLAVYWIAASQMTMDSRLVLLMAILFLISSAAFPLNDIWDQRIDGVAHKERPLALGQISARNVRIEANSMLALAFVLACFLGAVAGLMAAAFSVIVLAYSRIKESVAALGNILTAGLFAAAVASPLFVQNGPFDKPLLFALASLCGFVMLGREIVKDIQDRDVDLRFGRNTVPITYGLSFSYRMAGLCICLAGLIALFILTISRGQLQPIALLLAVILFGMGIRLLKTRASLLARNRAVELRLVLLLAIGLVALGAAL